MATELTPYAVARIRRWMTLLATDESAPPWNPTLRSSTPETLRGAARWIVDNGHAFGLDDGMVCILLAHYIVDHPAAIEDELVPRDAA